MTNKQKGQLYWRAYDVLFELTKTGKCHSSILNDLRKVLTELSEEFSAEDDIATIEQMEARQARESKNQEAAR